MVDNVKIQQKVGEECRGEDRETQSKGETRGDR